MTDSLSINRSLLIASHRASNWEEAAILSQERERLKIANRKRRLCAICGIRISKGIHCMMHRVITRYYSRSIGPIAAMILCLSSSATGGDVNVILAWDAVLQPHVSGYIVHYGNDSRNYSLHTYVGQSTSLAVVGLSNTNDWYFAVTATNLAGLESDYSNEVVWLADPPFPPVNLRIYTGVQVAPSPVGPWTNLWTTRIPIAVETGSFYRSVVEINNAPPSLP